MLLSLAACNNTINKTANAGTEHALAETGLQGEIKSNQLRAVNDQDYTVRQFYSDAGFSCTVHVLSSEKGNIIVDPGHFSREMQNYVEEIGGVM